MSRPMRFALALVVSALAASGCTGRDLRVLCDTANEVEARREVDSAARAQAVARLADQRLTRFGDVRELVAGVATARPSDRWHILKVAASDYGHPEWNCPALERMVAPAGPAASR